MGVREKYRHRPPLAADWAERLALLPPSLARHGVRLAYLFGSARSLLRDGTARHQDGSGRSYPADLDLAYLPAPIFRFRPFYADISKALRTDRVDLVNLDEASPGLLYEIVKGGQVIYRDSVETENAFEHSVLARYRDEAVRLARFTKLLKEQESSSPTAEKGER